MVSNMAYWYDRDRERLNAEVCIMHAHTRAELSHNDGTLFWIEEIISQRRRRRYRLMIAYPERFPYARPRAYILRPNISKAPHKFLDGSLCLFNSQSFIDPKTTALVVRNRALAWVFTYEGWLRSRVWKAPEHQL